jgi:hypothetical protein
VEHWSRRSNRKKARPIWPRLPAAGGGGWERPVVQLIRVGQNCSSARASAGHHAPRSEARGASGN